MELWSKAEVDIQCIYMEVEEIERRWSPHLMELCGVIRVLVQE